MSAAEKLKALDKRMWNVRTRRIVTTAAGHDLFVTVSDALPQILAVVEAVERLADSTDDEWFYSGGRAETMRALAALDEKLA